jgi:glycosyltransferase involved in cell wall biosynthesis
MGDLTRSLRRLSIIVPVYNEKTTLPEIMRRVRDAELPDGIEREIIVVDDGSTDGSCDRLKQFTNSNVHVIRHDRNRGKGSAVRTGLTSATGDYVLIQDADLEYDPKDWLGLLNPVIQGKARVVYGSRFTGERWNMLFLRWVGNRFLSLLTNVLYDTTISDMETCYKLIDRELMQQLGLQSERFDLEPEITAKILKRKIRIYEVPVSCAGREYAEGKKFTWHDGLRAIGALVKYRFISGR